MSYVSDALIDAQKREIERLEAENVALESENASLRGAVQGLGELCDRYKAENAKLQEDVVMHALNNGMLVKCVTDRNDALKELVLEMYQTMVDRCDGPHAPYHGKPCSSCAEAGSSDCPKVIAERMRKLGIEVE